MTPKSMGYGCGGKVKKYNVGGDVHMKSKKFNKGDVACCAGAHAQARAELQKKR